MRRRLFPGCIQILTAQGGRPGVKCQLAVGPVDLRKQIEQRIGVERQIVMILNRNRHFGVAGPVTHFTNDAYRSAPQRRRVPIARLIRRKDAHDRSAKRTGNACQRFDVRNLHLSQRHFSG